MRIEEWGSLGYVFFFHSTLSFREIWLRSFLHFLTTAYPATSAVSQAEQSITDMILTLLQNGVFQTKRKGIPEQNILALFIGLTMLQDAIGFLRGKQP
jgi:hypothetical protein